MKRMYSKEQLDEFTQNIIEDDELVDKTYLNDKLDDYATKSSIKKYYKHCIEFDIMNANNEATFGQLAGSNDSTYISFQDLDGNNIAMYITFITSSSTPITTYKGFPQSDILPVVIKYRYDGVSSVQSIVFEPSDFPANTVGYGDFDGTGSDYKNIIHISFNPDDIDSQHLAVTDTVIEI